MKVLSVSSEVFPLIKTGGLADVVGALPVALKPYGVETKTLVPGYPAVMAALTGGETVMTIGDSFGAPARLVAGKAKGLDIIALDAQHLFNRPGKLVAGLRFRLLRGPGGYFLTDHARQRAAQFGRASSDAQVGAARHNQAGIAAGVDVEEGREVQVHVQAQTVKAAAAAHFQAEGGDFRVVHVNAGHA